MGLEDAKRSSWRIFLDSLVDSVARRNVGSTVRHKAGVWPRQLYRLHHMHARAYHGLFKLPRHDLVATTARLRCRRSLAW